MSNKPRNFQTDFCAPVMTGMSKKDAIRVGIALDAAIAFGVLEHLDGNISLQKQNRTMLEEKYWENVQRLKKLAASRNLT